MSMLYYCKYLLFISITLITKKLSNLEHAACQNGLTLLFLTFHFYSGKAFCPVMSIMYMYYHYYKMKFKVCCTITHTSRCQLYYSSYNEPSKSACLLKHTCMFPTIYILEKIFLYFRNSTTKRNWCNFESFTFKDVLFSCCLTSPLTGTFCCSI